MSPRRKKPSVFVPEKKESVEVRAVDGCVVDWVRRVQVRASDGAVFSLNGVLLQKGTKHG